MQRTLATGLLTLIVLGPLSQVLGQEQPAASPKGVQVDIVIVEHPSRSPLKLGEAETPSIEQLTELEKQGKLNLLTRIRLATVENVQATVRFGDQVATAVGRVNLPGGFGGGGEAREARPGGFPPTGVTRFSMTDVGTVVNATPRVEADGSILIELRVDQSRVEPRSVPEADKADATNPRPEGVSMFQVHSTVRVPPGKSIVTGGQRAQGKDGKDTWMVISARVLGAK